MTGSAKTGLALVHICVLLKKSVNFLNFTFLVKEGPDDKTGTSSYSSAQEELENLFFVAVDTRILHVETIIHD